MDQTGSDQSPSPFNEQAAISELDALRKEVAQLRAQVVDLTRSLDEARAVKESPTAQLSSSEDALPAASAGKKQTNRHVTHASRAPTSLKRPRKATSPPREGLCAPAAPTPLDNEDLHLADGLKGLKKRWTSAWREDLSVPHCGLCGIAHDEWTAAGPHLEAAHPEEWALIVASGGLDSEKCSGCACGYVSYAKSARDATNHRQLHSGEELTTNICGIDGCMRGFRKSQDLIAHQESSVHHAIPYYCPLTAEHCPRAPCGHSSEGGAALLGRKSLVTHLTKYHRGHRGREAGLDLSWGGVVAFRAKGREGEAAAVAAAGAPAAVAAAGAHAAAVAVPPATGAEVLAGGSDEGTGVYQV